LDSTDNILTAEGRNTGVVVDIGEQGCFASAVYKGHFVSQPSGDHLNMMSASGREINDKFAMDFANETGIYFTKSHDREATVRDIKE
jgi:hypothetical protein